MQATLIKREIAFRKKTRPSAPKVKSKLLMQRYLSALIMKKVLQTTCSCNTWFYKLNISGLGCIAEPNYSTSEYYALSSLASMLVVSIVMGLGYAKGRIRIKKRR